MSEKNISVNIETTDDEAIFILANIIDNELKVKFIHNFEQAVDNADKLIKVTKDMKLTINYSSTFDGEFDDRIQTN